MSSDGKGRKTETCALTVGVADASGSLGRKVMLALEGADPADAANLLSRTPPLPPGVGL